MAACPRNPPAIPGRSARPPHEPAGRPGPGRRRARGGGRRRPAGRRWRGRARRTVLGLSLALRSGAAPPAPPAPAGIAAPAGSPRRPESGRLALAAGRMPLAAAPPTGGTVHKGKATFYDSKGAGGNCSYPSAPANRLYVALGPTEYSAGAACGGYLDVTGPRGTVRVLIMDQCPECAPGHVDLSREAFARIADPVQGLVSVSYRAAVDPALSGPLTFRIKEGASQYWFAALVAEHGNPLRPSRSDRATAVPGVRRPAGLQLLADRLRGRPRPVRRPGHRRVRQPGHRRRRPMSPGQVQRSTVGCTAAAPRPRGPPRPPGRPASPRATPSRTPASPSAVASATAPAPQDGTGPPALAACRRGRQPAGRLRRAELTTARRPTTSCCPSSCWPGARALRAGPRHHPRGGRGSRATDTAASPDLSRSGGGCGWSGRRSGRATSGSRRGRRRAPPATRPAADPPRGNPSRS